MEIYYYSKSENSELEKNLCDVQKAHSHIKMHRYRDISTLLGELNILPSGQMLVLVIEDSGEMGALSAASQMLKSLKMLIVIKNWDKELFQEANKLRPRVVYPDWVCPQDIAYSVERIALKS